MSVDEGGAAARRAAGFFLRRTGLGGGLDAVAVAVAVAVTVVLSVQAFVPVVVLVGLGNACRRPGLPSVSGLSSRVLSVSVCSPAAVDDDDKAGSFNVDGVK